MTKNENIILAEVATDIRWLKQKDEENAIWLQKSLDKIEVHLAGLNDSVSEHSVSIATNKKSITLAWRIIISCTVPLGVLISKILGVF